MKLTMSTSGMILTILAIVLACWDAVAVYFFGIPGSVTAAFIQLAGFNPFGFCIGVLCGHLFCNVWGDSSRLKAAWDAYKDLFINEVKPGPEIDARLIELNDAIEEIINAPHGPLRYFKRKK